MYNFRWMKRNFRNYKINNQLMPWKINDKKIKRTAV